MSTLTGGGETSQIRHSRAPSRESRGTRRNIARFRLLPLKRNAPDDLWILGTGAENDDALWVAPSFSPPPAISDFDRKMLHGSGLDR